MSDDPLNLADDQPPLTTEDIVSAFVGGEPDPEVHSEAICVLVNHARKLDQEIAEWRDLVDTQQVTIKNLDRNLTKKSRELSRAKNDSRLLNGALLLLNRHGIMPSSTELIAASTEYERNNP